MFECSEGAGKVRASKSSAMLTNLQIQLINYTQHQQNESFHEHSYIDKWPVDCETNSQALVLSSLQSFVVPI